MVRSAKRRSREAGFTILEAMVVVSIIAISAALAAPALSEAMAVRRAGEASHSVVRIGARARAEAIAYGRAHLLRFTTVSSGSSSSSDGRIELWRGRSNLCTANDWSTLAGATCAASPDCLEAVDMGQYDHGTHRVQMTIQGGASAAVLCVQPDGELRFMTGPPPGPAALWTTTPPGGGSEGVVFVLERLENGGAAGVTRRVVFPFGGTPRILR